MHSPDPTHSPLRICHGRTTPGELLAKQQEFAELFD
jgi:hypothetical protein